MSVLPESKAAARLASMVASHLEPAWLTDAALNAAMRKLVADPAFVRSVLDEMETDPKRIGPRGEVLKQERTSSLSDEDAILERLHHLKSEESYLNACLAAMGSVYAPSLVDRDERGAQEDQDRFSREIADEKATNGAPRLAG